MIGIYARQSVERQDSVSIEAQIAQCVKFAQDHYEVYQDIGFSGKNTLRPAFERMIEDIKDGRITTVISYRLDRISRSLNDFAKLLELFDRYHVQYISATEQFDTSSPIGRAMIYIVMVFAQLERETIALRIEDNYKYRARQGLYMGGNTPYGYTSTKITQNNKQVSILVIDQDQSNILIKIVHFLFAGHSPAAIARILNDEGIPNRNNKPWTSLGIKRVLRNISPCTADQTIYEYLIDQGYNISEPLERFDGQYGMSITLKNTNKNIATEISDQTVAIGMHPPILSSAEYIKIQHILDKDSPSSKSTSENSFLCGLVLCKDCGRQMSIKTTSYKGKSYTYFRCSSRKTDLCQNTKYIPIDFLEEQLTQALTAHIKDLPIEIRTVTDQFDLSAAGVISARMEALLDQIGKIDKKTDEIIMEKVKQLNIQLDLINKRLSEITAYETDSMNNAYLVKLLTDFGELNTDAKSVIIQAAIEHITADHNGEINIVFKF